MVFNVTTLTLIVVLRLCMDRVLLEGLTKVEGTKILFWVTFRHSWRKARCDEKEKSLALLFLCFLIDFK